MSSVLSVAGASKKHCRSLRRSLWYGVQDIARELIPGGARDRGLRRGEFWALDDVSFELGRGESLAVVGRNGAGKTTLLKLLYGLLKLDRGEVRLRGRAEAIIELGTGINPLLTGRENIRVGAALRGLDRRQENELRDHVIEFTELGEALDAPVQSYSAGMKARLSYAIAAHLQPELLLVDEVLAVGDMAFQRKCATHMRSYLECGGSLVLVSHSPWHIQAVCERGILLDEGRVVFAGNTMETLNALYERRDAKASSEVSKSAGPVVIEELSAGPVEIRSGGPLRVTVRYRAMTEVDALWGFSIWTADQWICIAGEHDMTCRTLKGEGELTCVVPRLPLVGGRYFLRASIVDPATRLPYVLHGWETGGTEFDVHAEPTAHEMAKIGLQQLVSLDVDWS